MDRVRIVAAACCLLSACGDPAGSAGSAGGASASVQYESVCKDWLEEAPAWEVRRAHPERPPALVELCPARGPRPEGVERTSLSLAPPCEIALRVELDPRVPQPDSGRPLRFEALVGIDAQALAEADAARELPAGARVRFRLSVNGAERSDVFVPLPASFPAQTAWTPLAGHGGSLVEVRRGDELVLSTALLGLDGAEIEDPPPLAVGVSRLWLSTVEERPNEPASFRLPNVVLIVMDTQRVDRLSAYGYERPTSPNLERLAARGVLFERAYSTASWTWPATASILTGLSPYVHGVRDKHSTRLRSRLETLAERMQQRGCATAGFSGNPLIGSGRNFDQGFDHFEGVPTVMRKSDVVVPPALEWLRDHADERFFLYLHLVDPHDPHEPRPEDAELLVDVERPGNFPENGFLYHSLELRKRGAWTPEGELKPRFEIPAHHFEYIDQMYDASVRTGDYWVGQVLDELEALGLTEETVVVYTSDHGEELLDHGQLEHGHTIFTELVHVPWVMAGPGVPEGPRVTGVVSNERILPVLEGVLDGMSNGEPEELGARAVFGRSSVDTVLYASEHGWWKRKRETPIRGMLEGGWSIQWAPEGEPWAGESTFEGGDLRLFHVVEDPGERHDLARLEPERAMRMARGLRAAGEVLEKAASDRGLGRAESAGEQTLDMLRELGYVDVGDDE